MRRARADGGRAAAFCDQEFPGDLMAALAREANKAWRGARRSSESPDVRRCEKIVRRCEKKPLPSLARKTQSSKNADLVEALPLSHRAGMAGGMESVSSVAAICEIM